MAYYTRPKHVVHFSYRDFEIDILKAFRGARHCDTDHKPRTRVCEKCGEKIVPQLVFLIDIDGARAGVDCASSEEAEEIARAMVDDQVDDDDDLDDEDDGTDRSETNEKGRGNKLILPPPPPPEPRTGIPNNVLHQMKKLGWIQRALAIINQHPKS